MDLLSVTMRKRLATLLLWVVVPFGFSGWLAFYGGTWLKTWNQKRIAAQLKDTQANGNENSSTEKTDKSKSVNRKQKA